MSGVPTVFDVPLDRLHPEDVRAFLSAAPGEGLIWEGKGTASLTKLKVKIFEGVCGLANQLGGVFIVGAEEDKPSGTWTFPGVENDCKEDAHAWIARIVNSNLIEPPPFAIRRWNLDAGRVGAVIEVEPTAIPPCMTRAGRVHLRVVGETITVRDPRTLTDLLRKGDEARDEAERRATKVLRSLFGHEPINQVAVTLAPTAAREDYSSRLFTQSFRETLLGVVGRLELGRGRRTPPEATMNRDGYLVSRGTVRPDSWAWRLYALWNGTVAVELAASPSPEAHWPPSLGVIVAQAWRAAAEPLAELTGIPDRQHVTTHFAMHMTSGFHLDVRGRHGPIGFRQCPSRADRSKGGRRWRNRRVRSWKASHGS
jgi:hypothetical protein